jgi:hypothetical protein
MKTGQGDDGAVAQGGAAALHGAHLRALEAVFRHPPAHNLEWMDVVSLIGKIGAVRARGGDSFGFEVGSERLLMHKPHTKELTTSDVVDLRHFLERAGWSAQGPAARAAARAPVAPVLVVAIDHHGAKIYRMDTVPGDASKREITPYDPHHFLHHMAHKGQSREQGQREAEEPAFYEAIAVALATGGAIVVVGHGTGTSNAAQYLTEYLRSHHRETSQRVVRAIAADLSAITPPQLLALAEQALPAPERPG